jgi:CubicO group peptidase (beta-lactamase class C family)
MSRNRVYQAVIGALTLLAAAIPAAAQKTKAAQLDAYISPFAKAGHFSGVVVVGEKGKIIYEKAFGFANFELRVPNTPETIIGIASITKPMTGIILRRLLEKKTVALAEPVSKYIPDFPNGDRITVDMLRAHRSGIPHRVMPAEMEAIPVTSAQMVENIKKAKLEFEPGAGRLYSSAGYTVLARILEIASGRTYADLLQEYVFAPAGMTKSSTFDGRKIIPGRSSDYLLDDGGLYNAPTKDLAFLVGAGSVLSTGRDVYAFGNAIVTGKYGEGTKASLIADNVMTANGSTNGHRAEIRFDTAKKYSYALISNLNSGANDMVLAAIRDIMEGKKLAPPVVPKPVFVPDANPNLAQFEGVYVREGGTRFDVTTDGKVLLAGDVKLGSIRPDCFFEFKYYGEVCFVRDASRKITHITWASPGFTSTWVKQ